MKRASLLVLALAAFSVSAFAQGSNSGFITSTECVTLPAGGMGTGGYGITGTWTGTLSVYGVVGQATPVLLGSATANASSTVSVSGYTLFKVCGNTVASGAAFVQITTSAAGGSGNGIGVYTVATLPAAPLTGTVAVVTNGSTGTDCTVGGGANYVLCRFVTGTGWGTFSGGSAAAGGATTQIQYNNAGALAGIPQWTTNGITTITEGATGVLNLSAASLTAGFQIPTGVGAAPTADGFASFNTTTHLPVWGSNTTTITLPTTAASAAHQWVNSYTQSTGVFTKTQPGSADLSDVANLVFNNLANTYAGGGLQDFNAMDLRLPNHASDPATCSVGQIEFNTVGVATKICTATNTWTALGAGGGTTTNALTMNNSNAGAASGSTFNGSAAVTISANSIGAASLSAANTYSGGGLQDFNAMDLRQPVHSSDPATCSVGQIEFNSVGAAMKVCTATNTWTALGAGGAPGGSTNDIQINAGGGTFGAVNTHGALTGQIVQANNAAAPTVTSPGINGRTVTTTSDSILCDSGTTLQDRGKVVTYNSASAVAVTLPDAGSSGCGSNFYFGVENKGAGLVTVSRTTTSTFDVYTGTSVAAGATSFTVATGQHAAVNSPDNTNWTVRQVNGGGGASGAVTMLSKTANYTTVAADFSATSTASTLVDYTCTTAHTTCTHTLPGAVTGLTSGGRQIVQNDCAGTQGVLIQPATLTLDGSATVPIYLEPCGSAIITFNGSNFMSDQGAIAQSNIGGFLTPLNYQSNGSISSIAVSNINIPEIYVFTLQHATKISNITLNVGATAVASVCDFGIFDTGGNRIFHGNASWDCHTATGAQKQASSTPVVLAPGTYVQAWCASVAATGVIGAGEPSTIDAINTTSGSVIGIGQGGAVAGTPSAVCTAGVLPTSMAYTINSNPSGVPVVGLTP